MQFGEVPLSDALGATLAHATEGPTGTLRKGHVLTSGDLAFLSAQGIASLTVARLDADDVTEDAAAGLIANALAGAHVVAEAPATGRSNLHADVAGVLTVHRAAIDRLNAVDPGITFATLPSFATVQPGRMVATVKIIPFAVPRSAVDAALAIIAETGPLASIAPFRVARIAVISTLLPALKSSIVDKTLKVLAGRLAGTGAAITVDLRVPHRPDTLAEAIARAGREADMVIVFGASAIVDRRDVIPDAVARAGGRVVHLGMPVDPGNLLLIGDIAGKPLIGAPGCARSPRENGFDWVLARMLAGIAVSPSDITAMGVGGLLMDIVSRPAPRIAPHEEMDASRRHVGVVVLAAGRSSRMVGGNKLLAEVDGKPLVTHAVHAAMGSGATSVVVVTGHMEAQVRAASTGEGIVHVHNPDFAEGMATSLKAGLAALPEDVEAAVILLGDMPRIDAALLKRLIAAYDPPKGRLIALPVAGGRRGNPVLLARRFFPEIMVLSGDVGAREIIRAYPEAIAEVEADAGIFLDLDTREALESIGGRLTTAP